VDNCLGPKPTSQRPPRVEHSQKKGGSNYSSTRRTGLPYVRGGRGGQKPRKAFWWHRRKEAAPNYEKENHPKRSRPGHIKGPFVGPSDNPTTKAPVAIRLGGRRQKRMPASGPQTSYHQSSKVGQGGGDRELAGTSYLKNQNRPGETAKKKDKKKKRRASKSRLVGYGISPRLRNSSYHPQKKKRGKGGRRKRRKGERHNLHSGGGEWVKGYRGSRL